MNVYIGFSVPCANWWVSECTMCVQVFPRVNNVRTRWLVVLLRGRNHHKSCEILEFFCCFVWLEPKAIGAFQWETWPVAFVFSPPRWRAHLTELFQMWPIGQLWWPQWRWIKLKEPSEQKQGSTSELSFLTRSPVPLDLCQMQCICLPKNICCWSSQHNDISTVQTKRMCLAIQDTRLPLPKMVTAGKSQFIHLTRAMVLAKQFVVWNQAILVGISMSLVVCHASFLPPSFQWLFVSHAFNDLQVLMIIFDRHLCI